MNRVGHHPKPQSQQPPRVYRITEAAGRFNIALISGEEPEGFVADHATLEDAKKPPRRTP
jgi:hypothetical protein